MRVFQNIGLRIENKFEISNPEEKKSMIKGLQFINNPDKAVKKEDDFNLYDLPLEEILAILAYEIAIFHDGEVSDTTLQSMTVHIFCWFQFNGIGQQTTLEEARRPVASFDKYLIGQIDLLGRAIRSEERRKKTINYILMNVILSCFDNKPKKKAPPLYQSQMIEGFSFSSKKAAATLEPAKQASVVALDFAQGAGCTDMVPAAVMNDAEQAALRDRLVIEEVQ